MPRSSSWDRQLCRMPSIQKASSALEEAAVDAAGAYVDGRCRNIIFKHKQLIRLFGTSGECGGWVGTARADGIS